jgi:hypothetical protein
MTGNGSPPSVGEPLVSVNECEIPARQAMPTICAHRPKVAVDRNVSKRLRQSQAKDAIDHKTKILRESDPAFETATPTVMYVLLQKSSHAHLLTHQPLTPILASGLLWAGLPWIRSRPSLTSRMALISPAQRQTRRFL